MKVLLRNTKTSRYYTGLNEWTADPSLALDFGVIEYAARLAVAEKLTETVVILRYDSPPCELSLPIHLILS